MARNRNRQHDNPGESVPRMFRNFMKNIYTAMPGIVEKYDDAKRRCEVRPALRIVFEDGKSRPRKIIRNVQVMWPRGGKFSIHFPLAKGDPVWLMFSMRGLSQFRRTHDISTPDRGSFFEEHDVVALAGFGFTDDIDYESGSVWQDDDKKRRIVIDDSVIRAQNVNSKVVVKEMEVEVDTPLAIKLKSPPGTLTHNDKNCGDTHTHQVLSADFGVTGPPV